MSKGQFCENCIHRIVCDHESKYRKACSQFLEARPQGKWEYLKEHITEMRDADGELNQKQTCQFILNLMGVVEGEGETE